VSNSRTLSVQCISNGLFGIRKEWGLLGKYLEKQIPAETSAGVLY
jgi:hypothetical protein